MANTAANYQTILLSGAGTYNFYPYDSTNYRTATTVHQIFCLATGTITIYPMVGPAFPWTPTSNSTSIDILVSAVTVSSGAFVAFKSKYDTNPFYSRGANQ
jgi:hypothetical protein